MNKNRKIFIGVLAGLLAVCFYGFHTIENQKKEIKTLRQQNDAISQVLLEQAVQSFDAHTMEFTWSFSFRNAVVQKTAAELTPEQQDLLQQYMNSLRFEKLVSMETFWSVDGGGGTKLEFDCPWGHMYIDPGRVFLKTPDGQEYYAHFEVDWRNYKSLLNSFDIDI